MDLANAHPNASIRCPPRHCRAPGSCRRAAPSLSGRASAGILRVAHGQIWATFDGPHSGPLNDLGDHVVGAGEPIARCDAGQRLVVEAWDAQTPAYFSWDPLPLRAHAPARCAWPPWFSRWPTCAWPSRSARALPAGWSRAWPAWPGTCSRAAAAMAAKPVCSAHGA